MTKPLDVRLREAKEDLLEVDAALARAPVPLPAEVREQIEAVTASAGIIDHWISLWEAREVARRGLDNLEAGADADDKVRFGVGQVKFQYARLLGVQAYLAANWSLADGIAAMAGRAICTPSAASNEASPAQLSSTFVGDKRKKEVATSIFESIHRIFGWPIGISYALRNHFLHDGVAQVKGANFFHGTNAASAFRISDAGWKYIEDKARDYKVATTNHRVAAGWLATPKDDLRAVLDVCESQVDDALGILAGTAAKTVRNHLGFLIGED